LLWCVETCSAIPRYQSVSSVLVRFFPLPFLVKSAPHTLDHQPKPVEVQSTQRRISHHISNCQPEMYGKASRNLGRRPEILIHPDALVGSPYQSAASKGREKRNAVDKLSRRPSHADLVHEPMHVEEGGGELVENEIDAVIIAEGPLCWLVGRAPHFPGLAKTYKS